MNWLTLFLCFISPLVLAFLFFILPDLLKKPKKPTREPGWYAERTRDGYPVDLPFVAAMKASQSGKFSVKGGSGKNVDSDKT
ncbi:MAG TPA: hypothetical protein VIY48_19495, partial [Candidatus Paceibacterota bacterium]